MNWKGCGRKFMLAYFKALYQHLPIEAEENHKRLN